MIWAKDNGIWKQASMPEALRVIGADSANANGFDLKTWEPLQPGDLILLFAHNITASNVAMTPSSGFVQIRTSSFSSSTNTAFFYVVPASGNYPSFITVSNASRLEAIVYRGVSGIGQSNNAIAAASITHTIPMSVSEGSLVAASIVNGNVLNTPAPDQVTVEAGWGRIGGVVGWGNDRAATTLGGAPSGALLRPVFTVNPSVIVNMIAVEILPK